MWRCLSDFICESGLYKEDEKTGESEYPSVSTFPHFPSDVFGKRVWKMMKSEKEVVFSLFALDEVSASMNHGI
jgi:hypothetical protein